MTDENAERGERRRRREEERRQAERAAPAEAAPFGASFGVPEHHAPSRRELREREAGTPAPGTPQRAVPDGPAAPVSYAQGGQRPVAPTAPNARVNIPVGEPEHRRRHSAEPPPAVAPAHTAAPAQTPGAQRRSRREMRDATPSVGVPVAAPSVTGGIRRLGPDGRLTPVEPASRSAEPPARTGELPSAQARAEALRQQAARAQAEREQVERERVERERLRAAREQAERHAREQVERDRLAAEVAERERVAAQERARRERLAAEQAERERVAAQQAERERLARERAERERAAAQEAERERLARERVARDAAERERAERAAREQVVRQQARPETAAAPTIGDSPMTRRTARAHASVPLAPGAPGAEDPAAFGRPMAVPGRPAGVPGEPAQPGVGGPWAVRPSGQPGRPDPQQRPARPSQPLAPAERRPGQYQLPQPEASDAAQVEAAHAEPDPRAAQYTRERQAHVLRERAERERVLASERERERLGAAAAAREQAAREQAARQQAAARPQPPVAPVDRFGTTTQGGPAVPRWSSVAETGQSQTVGRIPVESDEHAEAAETRLLRGRPSAQGRRPAVPGQQPGTMTGQGGPFGPVSQPTGALGAPAAIGGAGAPFGAQAPTSSPFGQAAPAAAQPGAAPSPRVGPSGPMVRPEPEDVFPDDPRDDIVDPDEDAEDARRPRLYSWAGGLALVLVAFLLGMLIFLVVQNGAESQNIGAGAAPGAAIALDGLGGNPGPVGPAA